MFTGLIKTVGTIREKRITATVATLTIKTALAGELQLGDSVAVNGVCLTAAALGPDWFRADVMPETWRSSNLSLLRPGVGVNLEPALGLQDRLGGHLVSGHVEGIGRISRIEPQRNAILIRIKYPHDLAEYIVLKGSIAVNGVSLTIQAVAAGELLVSLIPHTYRATNFPELRPGDGVNLETDLIAKYVVKAEPPPGPSPSKLTKEFLTENGFR